MSMPRLSLLLAAGIALGPAPGRAQSTFLADVETPAVPMQVLPWYNGGIASPRGTRSKSLV